MSIKISLKKTISEKQVKNYAVFSNENFKIYALSKTKLNKFNKYITNVINNINNKDHNFFSLNLNSTQKLIVIKLKKINLQQKMKNLEQNFITI